MQGPLTLMRRHNAEPARSPMRRELIISAAAAFLGLAAVMDRVAGQEQTAPAEKGIAAGFWYGLLKLGAIELRLGVSITAQSDGSLSGVLDSLDQGAKDIPMDKVTVTGRTVAFSIKPLTIT